MNNFIKFNTLILTFFMIFLDQSVAAERIFPLPKPSVDKEIKRSIFVKIRNYFIAGVVVLIPIGITVYLTIFITKISSKILWV